jgi:hypothetical protein
MSSLGIEPATIRLVAYASTNYATAWHLLNVKLVIYRGTSAKFQQICELKHIIPCVDNPLGRKVCYESIQISHRNTRKWTTLKIVSNDEITVWVTKWWCKLVYIVDDAYKKLMCSKKRKLQHQSVVSRLRVSILTFRVECLSKTNTGIRGSTKIKKWSLVRSILLSDLQL